MSALLTATMVLTGCLAPADPLVLERVEVNRVQNGWGLDHFAGPDVVRIAVDDCGLLGAQGWLVTDDGRRAKTYVVDCCSQAGCLSDKGLAADVSQESLGHRWAWIYLWPKSG